MKFLRFLCNLLLFFAVTVGVSLVQIGIYDLSAAQSSDVEGIYILAPDDEDIAYFDSYTFWAEDIGTNFQQPAKYRVRNWVNTGWWKKGTEWLDVAIDTTIAAVKPIVVPIAQINAVKEYHGHTINDITTNYDLVTYAYDGSVEAYNNALYEVYVIYGKGYGDAYTVGENVVPIAEYQYTGQYDVTKNSEADYGIWVARNKKLYNQIWKLNKYNSDVYAKYYKKFIKEDNGARHIKVPAVVLYYQQYVSLILALIFVIKYPINFFTGRYTGKKLSENQ